MGRAVRRVVAIALMGVALLASSSAAPQRRGGGGQRGQRGLLSAYGMPWIYDGRFVFCRLAFRESPDGDGGGWSVDYPRADQNFPFRLGELTTAPISRDSRGEPNHVVVVPSDPNLFRCPFLMMTEPAAAGFDDDEAANLRLFLDKGGFLWADDFWGEYAWAVWEREIRKVLPAGEFPIVDLPKNHPLFSIKYVIREVPQIPSITFWFGNNSTSERFDSQVPHARAIFDARGKLIVLMTHNTDIGDSWEREGEDRRYFDRFATAGYAFGINVYLYVMTH